MGKRLLCSYTCYEICLSHRYSPRGYEICHCEKLHRLIHILLRLGKIIHDPNDPFNVYYDPDDP